MHPMSQFAAAITACNTESHFKKAYEQGVHKSTYWEHTYEDAMDLIAKLPTIAAIIYRNLYRDQTSVGAIQPDKDWSANFTSMLGYEDPMFTELVRSALSDPYLSFAAGINGLAGPLHGLANQEVLLWVTAVNEQLGGTWTKESLKEFVWNTLAS